MLEITPPTRKTFLSSTMNKLIIFCLCLIVPCVWSAPKHLARNGLGSTPYKTCGGKSTVTAVKIANCGTDCPLKRGTNATFEVDFKSEEDTASLKSVVHGVIGGIPIPFPLDDPDGCHNAGVKCPVSNGKSYKFIKQIAVKASYPKVKLIVKWEEKDAQGNDVFCILIPAEIVD